ncbi:MAG: hypothetical protein WB822_08835, partial [Rhodoplanes sp.]
THPHDFTKRPKKNELDASARRGVTQIREWREWLQNNLDMARRPVEQDVGGGKLVVEVTVKNMPLREVVWVSLAQF